MGITREDQGSRGHSERDAPALELRAKQNQKIADEDDGATKSAEAIFVEGHADGGVHFEFGEGGDFAE